MSTQRRQQDIRRIAKILRDGNYTYDQSKDLFKAARQRVGLQVSKQKKGSVDRLTKDEFEAFLNTAYARSGAQGLLIRTLLETGSRVSAFCRMRVEDPPGAASHRPGHMAAAFHHAGRLHGDAPGRDHRATLG